MALNTPKHAHSAESCRAVQAAVMVFQSPWVEPRSPCFVGRATKKVNDARLPGGEDKGRLLAADASGGEHKEQDGRQV